MVPRLAPLLATLAVVGCAAPKVGGDVSDSEGAVSGRTSGITRASVAYDASFNQIREAATFAAAGQAINICHAYQDGTDAQKHACDNYPANFTSMSCADARDPDPAHAGELVTTCNQSAALGQAPYDTGDGTYRVVFVNKNDPTNRIAQNIALASDFFQLKIDVLDSPFPSAGGPVCNGSPSPDFYEADRFFDVEPGLTEVCPKTLRLRAETKKGMLGQLKACATGFSTTGLSAAEIAAKDAESIKACESGASAAIYGRDGWIPSAATTPDRDALAYDVTPLLTPSLHVIFSFSLNEKVHSYVFDNNPTLP